MWNKTSQKLTWSHPLTKKKLQRWNYETRYWTQEQYFKQPQYAIVSFLDSHIFLFYFFKLFTLAELLQRLLWEKSSEEENWRTSPKKQADEQQGT